MSRPREKMVSVKMSGGEWWVVGLGGGTWSTKVLTLLKKKKNTNGTLQSSPLIKISSLKFYVP